MKSSFRFYCAVIPVAAAFAILCTTARATTFSFATDPFAGTNVLSTPGRQVVGGELFISFNIGADVFSFDPSVFGIGPAIQFANGTASTLPATGLNTVVLQSFDDDGIAGTPFGAGNAANLIAAQITTPGPGFFVYFNQSLDLPRLVYSTDLSDNTADLRILARMLNLNGQTGRDAMSTFSAANFEVASSAPASVPEAASPLTLVIAVTMLVISARIVRRQRQAELLA